MGSSNMAGFFVGSSSDKLFNTLKLTNAMAFYGRNVYSNILGTRDITLPDGKTFTLERRSALYVGVGVASQPALYGSYFLPLASYFYEGEIFTLNLGVPLNRLAIAVHPQHRLEIELGLDVNFGFNYIYEPTEDDTLSLQYYVDELVYILSEENEREYGLRYQKHWIMGKYSHRFQFLEAKFGIGYMPLGYHSTGKSLKTSPSGRLPKEMLYSVSLKAFF
jgi:hypothetical protein